MNSRTMLITFEDLLRTTDSGLQFDVNIDTSIIYTFLTRAEQEYIVINFLSGDTILDNINAVRKRSDVLRNIIKRTGITGTPTQLLDGGYEAVITDSKCWLFLSGVLKHQSLPTTDEGSDVLAVNLDLVNHYDLQKKIRTITNEPILKTIPIVLEGANKFVFYLSSEYESAIGGANIGDVDFEIIYLSFPLGISESLQPSLSESTHNDIVKLAVDMFIKEYKYLLGKQNNQPK